ncbi:MAG TPA: o-succinylbenzoate synthase [Actinomycetota bacterium]|nr:o-succinylbenzoate synthase [Actinomycetota bacterium]
MSVVRAIELRSIGLPLVRAFRTSFGTSTEKVCMLARLETDEGEGWGECVADVEPGYSEEFNEGAWLVVRDHLAPALLRAGDLSIDDLDRVFAHVRGNPMAKAALIDAFVDAELRVRDESLATWLGAERNRVACGVSIGITDTTEELLDQVEGYLSEGYLRIKLKIAPGLDVERVAAVRAVHPGIVLSVDANAAYSIDDIEVFRALDDLDLLMIEQPLHHADLVRHAQLQGAIHTALCLDESIRSSADASAAIELGSCRIVNIKQGRVGGIVEARRVHDVCRTAGVPVWCGGMLETGIGRAQNLALAAMPGFTLPGDTSASARYFLEDLTEPFVMSPDGTMSVPTGPGIGVSPRPERLTETTLRTEVLTRGLGKSDKNPDPI